MSDSDRPAKQPRLDAGPSLMSPWLCKAQLEGPWSPGAIQSTRAVCLLESDEPGSDVCVIAALGTGVTAYKVATPRVPKISQGKEGVFLPTATEVSERYLIPALTGRAEIMSLALHGGASAADALVAAVDSLGHCVIGRLSVSGREVICRETSACSPATESVEPGWTGASFASGGAALLATARRYSRVLDLYDGDMHVRSVLTVGHPTAVQFMPVSDGRDSVVAIAESSQVSVIDLRVPDSGCFVQRLLVPGGGTLHAITTSSSATGLGLVAAGGADRDVHVYDSRTWTPIKRWLGATRQTITGLEFSIEDPDFMYVAATDCEVTCRKWNIGAQGKGRKGSVVAADAAAAIAQGALTQGCSFRGDHRWVGFCRAPRSEIVAAITQNGAAYIAARGFRMAGLAAGNNKAPAAGSGGTAAAAASAAGVL